MRAFHHSIDERQMGLISDTALREPVTITRHGRPALVVTSIQDYQALQTLKHAQLKADIQEGLDDIAKGRFSNKSADQIIAEGKKRLKTHRARAGR